MRRRFENRPFRWEALIFWSWVGVLTWAPVPLGSNRPWAWAVLEAMVFALAALWLVLFASGRVQLTDPFRGARWLLLVLLAWLIYQALFIVPLPVGWIAFLSPAAAALYETARTAGVSAPSTLAVEPHAAVVSFLKSLAYVLAFVLTLLVVTGRERARQLAYALVIMAFVLSVYGILMHLSNVSHLWFGTEVHHGLQASATYANRNHFAGYLEMTLAVGIGLLIAGLRNSRPETWRQWLRRLLEWIFGPKMRLRLVLCVLVIALVTTRSRMGNTAFFASMLVAGAIGLALSRHATRGTVVLLASLIAIDLFIVGSWFGVEKLAKRIEQTAIVKNVPAAASPGDAKSQAAPVPAEQSMEERAEPATYGLDLIRDFRLIGAGPGSWYIVFPRYRGPDVVNFYDYAHNDYIQFAAESGLLGLVLLGVIVVWTLAAALLAQYRRRDPLMRGLSFASLMGTIAILIHSSVDFNLQIPANAMLFMVLLAFAWIALHLDRRA